MVSAKLFSFQICICQIEPVFFKVADEKKGKGRIPVGFFSLVGINVSSVQWDLQ